MSIISSVEAREHFSELVNHTLYGKERVVLTRRGKDSAVLVPLEDLKLLEALEDKLDLQEAKLALKEAEEFGTISLTAFKKQLSSK